jgi:hypothetical protein
VSITELADRIEQSGLGVAIAESRYLWPIVEGTHLLSLALSVGLILLTDLRMVGLFLKTVPLSELLRGLRPYFIAGFTLTIASGVLVFCSEASEIITNPLWLVKMLLILLGGGNALYFELVIARRPEVRENRSPVPASIKYAGWASMSIWALVVVCGRMLAYSLH